MQIHWEGGILIFNKTVKFTINQFIIHRFTIVLQLMFLLFSRMDRTYVMQFDLCYFQICISSELETMANIVQDLESQLAKSQEENATLSQNLEELDEQHQGAIGK